MDERDQAQACNTKLKALVEKCLVSPPVICQCTLSSVETVNDAFYRGSQSTNVKPKPVWTPVNMQTPPRDTRIASVNQHDCSSDCDDVKDDDEIDDCCRGQKQKLEMLLMSRLPGPRRRLPTPKDPCKRYSAGLLCSAYVCWMPLNLSQTGLGLGLNLISSLVLQSKHSSCPLRLMHHPPAYGGKA